MLDYGSPEKLRENARQCVLEKFEMKKVAFMYKSLYEDVLSAKV